MTNMIELVCLIPFLKESELIMVMYFDICRWSCVEL